MAAREGKGRREGEKNVVGRAIRRGMALFRPMLTLAPATRAVEGLLRVYRRGESEGGGQRGEAGEEKRVGEVRIDGRQLSLSLSFPVASSHLRMVCMVTGC